MCVLVIACMKDKIVNFNFEISLYINHFIDNYPSFSLHSKPTFINGYCFNGDRLPNFLTINEKIVNQPP